MSDLPESLARLIESDLPPMRRCFSFLKEAILLGYLKKGQRIVERELVDLLKVSRPPVREAIGRLVEENLLAHYPHRGVVVVGFSERDIKEMYDLRIVLECFLVRRIVEEVDTPVLEKLKENIQRQHDGELPEGERLPNFHVALLSLVRHRWLGHFLGQLEEYIDKFHVLSFLRKGRAATAHAEHMQIVDALIARDAERAERIMRAHLNASLAAFLEVAPIV